MVSTFCYSVFPHIRTLAHVIEKEPYHYCFAHRPRAGAPLLCRSAWNMCRPCYCHATPALMRVGRAAAAMYCFACFPSFTASSIALTYISLGSSFPASVVCHGWRAKLQFTEFTRLCLSLPCLSLTLLILSTSACLCSTVRSTRQAGRSPPSCCCCSCSAPPPILFFPPCERARALEHRRCGHAVRRLFPFPSRMREASRPLPLPCSSAADVPLLASTRVGPASPPAAVFPSPLRASSPSLPWPEPRHALPSA